MAEIRWTDESCRWLEDIYEYIAADNPLAAAETVEAIYRRAQLVSAHPLAGHRYRGTSRNVRIILHGHYRIAYLLKDNGDVDILGVFHGALDISRYLL